MGKKLGNLECDGYWEGNRTGARDGKRLPLTLVSHHRLSPEFSNSLLDSLLASSLVPINPHLVMSNPHLKLVNSFLWFSEEKSKFFNKDHKALTLPLPNPCPPDSVTAFVSTVPSSLRSDGTAHE